MDALREQRTSSHRATAAEGTQSRRCNLSQWTGKEVVCVARGSEGQADSSVFIAGVQLQGKCALHPSVIWELVQLPGYLRHTPLPPLTSEWLCGMDQFTAVLTVWHGHIAPSAPMGDPGPR